MDYSKFTEELFDERYETIPASLRAAFESDKTKRTLENIEREHYLNPDKSVILEQLVGLTLMGFIPLRNLSREVGEQLFLNFEHAQVLTNEIYNRVLAPYEDEITETYKSVEEMIAEKEQIDEAINSRKKDSIEQGKNENNEETIRPSFFSKEINESPIKIETSEDAPLIIHEEPSFFTKQDRSDREKQIETPFNRFIPSSSESIEKKAPRAKIEGGNNPFSFLNPAQKTTVHYSETRTGLKQEIGPENEVVSIGAIDRMTQGPQEEQKILSETKPLGNMITIQTPEVINIAPTIATKADTSLIESAVMPEQKPEKKSSWISNIFNQKNNINKSETLLPEIQIHEQKPEITQSVIQGNTINLK
ncbi:MAG: hypothetical protein WC842_01345 [Candidatus Paceibacterota bacterium]|jgi:hypothetical protein